MMLLLPDDVWSYVDDYAESRMLPRTCTRLWRLLGRRRCWLRRPECVVPIWTALGAYVSVVTVEGPALMTWVKRLAVGLAMRLGTSVVGPPIHLRLRAVDPRSSQAAAAAALALRQMGRLATLDVEFVGTTDPCPLYYGVVWLAAFRSDAPGPVSVRLDGGGGGLRVLRPPAGRLLNTEVTSHLQRIVVRTMDTAAGCQLFSRVPYRNHRGF